MPKAVKAPVKVNVLEEALKLHRAGWWVVPQQGKQAVVLGWPDVRLTEDDLRAYLEPGNLNIAVALSRSDYMDVEIDGEEGARTFAELTTEGDRITPTWRSKRGLHRLYVRPPGLPEMAKVVVRGIEFRIGNKGALSTVPPSVHPEGGRYEWLDGLSCLEMQPSPLPESLLALVKTWKPNKRAEPSERPGVFEQGRRNDELFRYGCRLVRSGWSEADVANGVVGANANQCNPALSESEVSGILASVEKMRVKQQARGEGVQQCRSWEVLERKWEGALDWRRDLSDVLSVMLAVCLSTEQVGDQLMLYVIGPAGSAKTKLCEGLLHSSRHCAEINHIKRLMSGWKGADGEDCSYLARSNRMTWVTPEGDTLVSAPQFLEIMGQLRRVFDGKTSNIVGNRNEDMRYGGLRTPWIIAGTPAILNFSGQAHLGDRFLKVHMDPPTEAGKWAILERVGYTALRNVKQRSNCTEDSILDPDLLEAYRHTGGYVDWLRDNCDELLDRVEVDEAAVITRCARLADLTAMLRARPDPGKNDERHDAVELPTRLTHQFLRTASCLAVTTGRFCIDDEVMRIVTKLALDTGRGRVQNVVRKLFREGAAGAQTETLGSWMSEPTDKIQGLLRFMSKHGLLKGWTPVDGSGVTGQQRWKLTDRMAELWSESVT